MASVPWLPFILASQDLLLSLSISEFSQRFLEFHQLGLVRDFRTAKEL